MSAPFLSVIIPVYNVAPYLRDCLDSVLAQIFSDWEAVCVDDGSADSSGAIIDEYAARDSRFRIYHQKNSGVSAARNKALDEARGEYVLIIDADDKIVPDVPIAAIKLMKEFSLDFCSLARQYPWAKTDKNIGATHKMFWGQIQVGGNVFHESEDVIQILRKVGMSSSGVVYRRDFLQQNNLRYPIGVQWNEDFVFITSLVLGSARFGVYDEVGYIISSHQDSLSHRTGEQVGLSMNRAAILIMEMLDKVNVADNVSRYYAGMNRYQILYKWSKNTKYSIRRYNITYKHILTRWALLLNNLIIIFPCMWFGRFGVLKFIDRLLARINWYYRDMRLLKKD